MMALQEESITHETLREIVRTSDGPVVSVFQPTFRATFHEQQNRNRLKTLLARSEPLLAARGLSRQEIDRLLGPSRRLIQDAGFWRDRLDGLALYAGRDFLRFFRVRFELPELVEVSDAPCIRPLLPALAPDAFFVLALSRNQVRLLQGTRARLEEVDLGAIDIPRSLAEALRYDDFERQMQSHSTIRADVRQQTHSQSEGRAGRHMWHGHGGGEERVKEQIGRFFNAVDVGICKLLSTDDAPLIVAAVAYEADLYRRLSNHPRVVAEAIDGNPDRLSATELHAGARPIAERVLLEPLQRARRAFVEAADAGTVSDNIGEVLRAAHEGRVQTLLLRDAELWGGYDPETARTEIRSTPDASDTDLLDLAVRRTIEHGGEAYQLSRDEMPTGEPIAAVFRF